MLLLAALFVAAGVGAVAVGMARSRQLAVVSPDAVEVPVEVEPLDDAEPHLPFLYRLVEPAYGWAGRAGRALSPRGRLDLLRDRIVMAGLEATLTIERLCAYKALAAVVLAVPALVAAPARGHTLWILGAAVIGFFVPDLVLDSKARARQSAIGRELSEALDLLAITVEAGLGLEQALAVVSENLEGPLGDELTRLLREVELGVPRREALAALRDRTSVPELSGFVVALVQADAMGISIADVLRVQASQVRLKRRQHAREQAAKTPVKILFPVVFGILPALMVVVLGPTAVTIAQNLISPQ
jgi:tight adherence protein C